MNKRLLAVLAVIGFCGTVWVLVSQLNARSPVYQGKTVKAWLLQHSAADARAREEAEAALQALGTRAVPELARLVRADDARWRKLVWHYVPRMPEPVRSLVLPRVHPPQAYLVRPAAARALGKLGPGAASATRELEQALRDNAQGTGWEAAGALGRIGGKAVPDLTLALHDQDAAVRRAAAHGLAEAGPEAAPAIPALMEMLRQGSTHEQQMATQCLARIGTPAVAPLIDLLMREAGPAGQAAAGVLLQHYGRPGPHLAADNGPPADATAAARQQAVEALAASSLASNRVTRLLAGAVKDPAPGVRLAAIKALAQSNRQAQVAMPWLAAALRDESPAVREWSARALGQIGPPAKPAIPALTQLTQNETATVRAAAQEALAAIRRGGVTNAVSPPK